jgi:hypothetical protein
MLMGIDPARAASLKRGEEAAAELAAIPDSEELRTADDAIARADVDDRVSAEFEEKMQRMVAIFLDGSQPDFAQASVAELWAYCKAVEKLAWGDRDRGLQEADFAHD